MLSSPSPPLFPLHNWVQRVLNREESSLRYEMKQIRRQTAKKAGVFLICRHHFRDCRESFASSYWETSALERELGNGVGEYAAFSFQYSHFLKKQLIEEKMWGTNSSHLPNISKGFKITQGSGFFPTTCLRNLSPQHPVFKQDSVLKNDFVV